MSWDALRYGARETESKDHLDDLLYNKDGGTGILDGFVLDTHFRSVSAVNCLKNNTTISVICEYENAFCFRILFVPILC